MVVVPAFAEGQKAAPGNVVTLHGGPLHDPVLWSRTMGEMTDQPMACQTDGDSQADSPKKPPPIADEEEERSKGNLLQHPGSFQKLIKSILRNSRFDFEFRWMVEHEVTVHLPDVIFKKRSAMCGLWMAIRLALQPVPPVMSADHSKRSRHADQCPEIDENVLYPPSGFETPVDKQSVHSDRMAGANRHSCEEAEYKNGFKGMKQITTRKTCKSHCGNPNRLGWNPGNMSDCGGA